MSREIQADALYMLLEYVFLGRFVLPPVRVLAGDKNVSRNAVNHMYSSMAWHSSGVLVSSCDFPLAGGVALNAFDYALLAPIRTGSHEP